MVNIGFMKPIEVALRTHKNDKNVPADSLPRGLMMAHKQSILDNKYTLKRFQPVDPAAKHLEDLKAKQMDNYISLLKKPEEIDGEAQRFDRMQSRMVSARISNIKGIGM